MNLSLRGSDNKYRFSYLPSHTFFAHLMDRACSLPSVLTPTRLKFLAWGLLRSCVRCLLHHALSAVSFLRISCLRFASLPRSRFASIPRFCFASIPRFCFASIPHSSFASLTPLLHLCLQPLLQNILVPLSTLLHKLPFNYYSTISRHFRAGIINA